MNTGAASGCRTRGPAVMGTRRCRKASLRVDKLTDKILKSLVMGLTAGLSPQDRHAHLSEKLPVRKDAPTLLKARAGP